MIIKSIKHSRMKNSISYLYDKVGPETDFIAQFKTEESKETFVSFIQERCEENINERGKSLKENTQYQHLVISFAPEDRKIVGKKSNEFVKELCEHLKIDPENHGVTAFLHNDRLHPHIHVVFSKVGMDGNNYNDSNSYRKFREHCKSSDHKHGLTAAAEKQKITLTRKDLYNPTKRGDLLKTIDFARKDSKSLTEFQQTLERHGVKTNKTKEGNFIYILKDRTAYQDHLLPKEARLKNLYTFIKSTKHDKAYLEKRKSVIDKICSTKSLLQIQKDFPEAKIQYEAYGNKLMNVKIEIENDVYNLSDTYSVEVDYNLKKQEYHKTDYMTFPLIFADRYSGTENNKDQNIVPKKGKKKQLGFKVKI